MKLIIDWTWEFQIELLPRLTILYGKTKGVAFEFLWLSISYTK